MRNTIILLSVLLAAAVISILILSWHYIDTKDEFSIDLSEIESVELIEKFLALYLSFFQIIPGD